MCDIKPPICMTSYEYYVTSQPLFMTSQDCIHDITSTQFMTSPHCIWHDIPSTCHITTTITMTRHLLCFWHYTQCIWHLTWWMNDTQRLYLTWYSMYLFNQTHLIDDITPYVRMKSHPLHVWHHRHFIWHYILTLWPQTTVFMYHTHYIWHRVHSVWMCHHIHCIDDITATVFLR